MLRFFGFLFWQAVCAVILVFVAYELNDQSDLKLIALVGALIGGAVWLFVDSSRSTRFLNWVRLGDVADLPRVGGSWSEAFD